MIDRFLILGVCFLTACTNQINLASPSPAIPPPTEESADEIIYSPDGLLVAKEYRGSSYSTNTAKIEIQDIKGSILWKIPFEGVILGRDGKVWIEIPAQGEQWKGEPNPSLYILEWSRDSQYLYFYYRLFVDGRQPLMDSYDLQRVNINTGVIEKVLQGTGDMAFSFSPNQEYLVYSRGQDIPRRVIIRNTSSGVEQKISFPEWDDDLDIGDFDWSPYSESELQFLTLNEEWLQNYYLNIQELSAKLVFEFRVEDYWNDGWFPNNILRFKTLPENEITEIDIAMPTPKIIGTATMVATP